MVYRFTDVVIDSRTGLNPRKNFVLGSGDNYYITIKDIYNGKVNFTDKTDKVDDEAIQIIKRRSRIKVGDVLFVSIGRIGETAIVMNKDDSWDVNESVFVFTLNNKIITPEYFCTMFQSQGVKQYLSGNSSGSTFKSIKMNQLERMTFDLPPVTTQKSITTKLTAVRRIIDLRTSQLAELDNLVKARFVELFGDPKLNDKGWNAGIVSDYYEVKGGKRIPKGMGYADGVTAHPYLRATDMKNETILDDDIHYIDEEVYALIKRYTVKSGDVYLTNVGVNLGMAGVIPEKYDGANLTENAVKLVPKTEKVIDGVFLAHYINSPGIQDYINARKMSVGVPKLAIFRIETMPLLLPPMDIQMQFIEFCKQADKSKVAVQKALNEAQLLFDSLMQKYFG